MPAPRGETRSPPERRAALVISGSGGAPALRRGDSGPGVGDLQARLRNAGLKVEDADGRFETATEEAVRAFQAARGLPVTGVCDRTTWSAVVESAYRLGDRLLYRRRPMLRGDDVASLQQRLSVLGFDPGRVDGIFGDDTVAALTDFQRNAGLPGDGICGPATVAELERLSVREGGGDPVSPLRERLAVRARAGDALAGGGGAGAPLLGQRVAVGEPGGFATGVTAISRGLRESGCTVLELHHPDASHHAAEANAAGVTCVLFFVLDPDVTSCSTAYYRGFRYESEASRKLALLMQAALPRALDLADGGVTGMALPILRETRMPAVQVRLGAPVIVVQRTAALARAVVEVFADWLSSAGD